MNITDLRRDGGERAGRTAAIRSAAAPEPPVARLSSWLGEFCRLHQVSVLILGPDGRPLLGPLREPVFCSTVGCAQGCPPDCGRSRLGVPRSSALQIFHCPYHLSNIAFTVRPGPEATWTVLVGRTLATQEQMARCLEVIEDSETLGDEALGGLGSIPWQAEPQLAAAARFLQATLELVLGGEWAGVGGGAGKRSSQTNAEGGGEDKDPGPGRRRSQRG